MLSDSLASAPDLDAFPVHKRQRAYGEQRSLSLAVVMRGLSVFLWACA
ncbi:MAG: hypothetical protein JWS10_1060 [Cypionkella sp.]|nr:hypothetical protein [Cypionkella sp.]